MTLGILLNLSVPQFPHMENRNIKVYKGPTVPFKGFLTTGNSWRLRDIHQQPTTGIVSPSGQFSRMGTWHPHPQPRPLDHQTVQPAFKRVLFSFTACHFLVYYLQSILFICRFLICESTYLLKFICDHKINACSAFTVIRGHAQNGEKLRCLVRTFPAEVKQGDALSSFTSHTADLSFLPRRQETSLDG